MLQNEIALGYHCGFDLAHDHKINLEPRAVARWGVRVKANTD